MITRGSGRADSLVGEFLYPREGFGRIPEEMAEVVPAERIHTSSPVTHIHHDRQRVSAVTARQDGRAQRFEGEEFVCTAAVTEMVRCLDPAPPPEVLKAADELGFRDLIVVFLGLNTEQVSEDHWIYFPDPELFFGRVHEPKNWSPAMAPDDRTGLVVEVFCYTEDPVWEESDDRLIQRAAEKLEDLGLIQTGNLIGGTVVRYPRAYPLYEAGYKERLSTIFDFLDGLENLQMAGRNALFRYTSGDRYIEMGMKAAHNILGREQHDLHQVATEQEYAEK
jgi:protoporphyrinogen oxidase